MRDHTPVTPEPATMPLTYIGQVKHTEILRLCRRLSNDCHAGRYGGQSLLARKLGVTPNDVGDWVRLKAYPKYRDLARMAELESRLIELTGKNIDTLFPPELRAMIDARVVTRVEVEREVPLSQLAGALDHCVAPAPGPATLDREELGELLEEALKTLTPRQRYCVRTYFGLDGEKLTLAAVGATLGISANRVRQIVYQVVNRLGDRPIASRLRAFIE